jgi:hypothetical protein
MWLSKLDDIANDVHDALTKSDVELYLKAGKATYEAELLEKSLEPLIALVRDEQFGPNYPVEELEVPFCIYFILFYSIHFPFHGLFALYRL